MTLEEEWELFRQAKLDPNMAPEIVAQVRLIFMTGALVSFAHVSRLMQLESYEEASEGLATLRLELLRFSTELTRPIPIFVPSTLH